VRILTLENTSYSMDEIPDQVDDLRYGVLDNSNPKNPDYFFIPMIFLESFNSPALVLKIGNHIVRMPVDWQILIGEPDVGDLEVVPLTSINDRGFSAFVFNPRTDSRPSFSVVEVIDIYQDIKWYFPKLRAGHLLAVPLEEGEHPACAYFVKDIGKHNDIVDFSLSW